MQASDIIKKKGETDGKSNKLGGGGRFKQMQKKGMSNALIAWIGDRRHGKKQMGKWAAKGRERNA
jgi:hypothetical protein